MLNSINKSSHLPLSGSHSFAGRLSEITDRFPTIMYSGMIMLAGAVVTILLMQVDSRTVLGISTWIKPTKFLLSGGVFLLTMGWIFDQIRPWNPGKSLRLSKWMAWLLNIETAMIVMQGARGVRSHFNTTTAFDGLIFSLMGIVILAATGILIYVCFVAWRSSHSLPPGLLWAIRLGLLISILASFEGGYMSALGERTIGATQDSAGLPFLNWSREGGDLRIAHFLGLHALQLLPLMAFSFRRRTFRSPGFVAIMAFFYAIIAFGTFYWAILGRPMIQL